MKKIKSIENQIRKKIKVEPEIGLILGSGLGDLADKIENPIYINYDEISGFPKSTVEGHEGRFVFGNMEGKSVVAMQGRFHFYEGYPIEDVVLPVRVMIALGIDKLIVTNAAGGVDESFKPGDLMIIKDHINFTGVNPLIGKNYDELGPRFPDMSKPYNLDYVEEIKEIGKSLGLELKTGNYMWFTGPTYETPAEVKMARILGASAVGMSTVPEVIVANHQGIEVIGISCITNMAAGILDQPLNHEEVVETSQRVKGDFQKLVTKIIKEID